MKENDLFKETKLDPLWQSKEGSQNSRLIEAIYVGINKDLVMRRIVGIEPRMVISEYLKLNTDASEEVLASINLIGNSEAENQNEVLASLIDILALKKLLIYIFEKQKTSLHSKLKIEKKELSVFKSDTVLKDVKFEEVCSKLLVAIFNIENLLLVSLDNNTNFGEEHLSLIHSGIIFDYNVFNDLIANLAEHKSQADLDGESNSFSQIIYYYALNALNFHLLSQTNRHSLNGDVVLTGVMENHVTQKTLPDFDNHTIDFMKKSMEDISLNFSLFLKFLNTETQSKYFTPTESNPKKIRGEILTNRIKIQEDWVKDLNPDRSIQEIKYRQFISDGITRQDFFEEALDYFLASYNSLDFESIFIENIEYIQNELEALSYSGNIENYRNLCKLLKIPCLDAVDNKVLALLNKFNSKFSIIKQISENEPNIQQDKEFNFNQLPQYFNIDRTSIEDYYKNDFFGDADRRYIQNIIQIIIDTKVNQIDDLQYKYLYLKKCLQDPAANYLPPRKIKTLNHAKKVIGISKIPPTHFRIRVNKRGRMIIGLDQVQNKLTLIITDDHDLLK
jgi:hypothetical protein